MEEKIYCGLGPVPKGHRLGTMQECLEKGQVKYWGVKKIDPTLLASHKKTKRTKKVTSINDIRIMQVSLRGKIKKKTGELQGEKNEKKIGEINKEINELKKKLAEVNKQAIQMEGVNKKSSSKKRSTPKKVSRKASTPKKVSRKASIPKKVSRKASSKPKPVRKASRKISRKSKK